jgi:hypothetical protein
MFGNRGVVRGAGACALTASLVLGCGAASIEGGSVRDDGTIANSTMAIRGGENDTTSTAVVGIGQLGNGGASICTGSLIAPNVVLTARHCVSDPAALAQGVTCMEDGYPDVYGPSNFYVTTKATMGYMVSAYHRTAKVIVPDGGKNICGNDVAILILRDPIDAEEAVPLVPAIDDDLAVGEQYTAIGYGVTSDTSGQGSGTRRRREGLEVVCIGDECTGWTSVQTSEWQGNAGVCQGDSGGPAIDSAGRVVGVVSRGLAGCSDPVYARISSWKDWIVEVTAEAAEDGEYPAPGWVTGSPTDPKFQLPTGDVCADKSECESGLCWVPGRDEPGYCTRECMLDDLAPCPEGWSCEEESGLLICRAPSEPTVGVKGSADDSADSADAEEDTEATVRACALVPTTMGSGHGGASLGIGVALLGLMRGRRRQACR